MSPRRVKSKTGDSRAGNLPRRGERFRTVTHSARETRDLGRALARKLAAPCVILLEGELGSGKTTLAKGIVTGLGAAREEEVTSPSFTLVHEYGEAGRVYHIDLYRVETAQELSTLGLDDVFARDAIVLIEWGEKLGENVPGSALRIQLEYAGNDDRRISIQRLEG